MKRLIALLVAAVAAVSATVALATPGSGSVLTILSRGTMQADLAYNTGFAQGGGLTWRGKKWSQDQLPEFLVMLRQNGVTGLGEWLTLHPKVAAAFDLVPAAMLKQPEIVTVTNKYPPGSFSGWHSHPGYLTATVLSGSVVRYDANCKPTTYTAGQSFYETGTAVFYVTNESGSDATLTATYVVPNGTPNTGLRVDRTQPAGCAK
jgi:quercetin dioxygenase-like cupin family protein